MARNSKVIIARDIKVDRDYKNVLTYSESQMLSLCQTNKVYENSTYEFLKENESPMYVACDYQTALKGNYIAFQNPNYSNKWFFAFIDRVEYNSENSTMIYFTIDVFSTWFDYWNKMPCMVMREHTNDDTIGANTIDEGLAVPDVMGNSEVITNFIDQNLYICLATNWDIREGYQVETVTIDGVATQVNAIKEDSGVGYNGASMYNKGVYGQMLCLFNFSDDGLRYLEHFINITNRQGHINDIHNMFIIPACIFTHATDIENNTFYFFKNGTLTQQNMIKTSYGIVMYSSSNRDQTFFQNVEMTRPVTLNNFVPKNNKVLCYPYNYLMVSNQVGEQNIYKIEDFAPVSGFADNKIVFQIQMALSVGMSCRIVPVNYKNRLQNFQHVHGLVMHTQIGLPKKVSMEIKL